MITTLLIANRGEIACRVIRTARALGIRTVAVYSDADRDALHVAMADEAVRIGPAAVSESYLNGAAIIAAARAVGADAIHPGYGFLSENPNFVDQVEAAGLVFVGPSAAAIRAMGLKDRAKALMEKAGVPVVPGYHGESQDPDFLADQAEATGFPVLIKARAGGGGKGMRLVERREDFADALESARREGEASFGDPACLVEKYIETPRHIEVQVFGDTHGNVVHLFERDCSLQRRHQKVIEEAPAPGMTQAMRAAMGKAAVEAGKAVGYVGAGTVEFIVDGSDLSPDGFWFMEMNTRLQVEHPVTEAITGLDLVALQITVAEGRPLPFAQDDLTISGHAVEARLYAEDPASGFLPATGCLAKLAFPPETGGIRIDTGVAAGDAITPHYDPMIAKIIAHGPDRPSALRKLTRALDVTIVAGCVVNRAFLERLSSHPDFADGTVDTGLIGRHLTELTAEPEPEGRDYALAALTALLEDGAAPQKPDPFAAYSNFRHFGPARQSVIFDGASGPVTVTVETDPDGSRRIETPAGIVELNKVARDGDRLRLDEDGAKTEVIAYRHGASIWLQRPGKSFRFHRHLPGAEAEAPSGDVVLAPMPGLVRLVAARAGDVVEKGRRLAVLEAMKMEHALVAPRDGIIAEVMAAEGDQVNQGAILLSLEPEG
ncbi:acetyl-CoA carboxylase biotin carboxylase subunit [Jiella mangrovi]|uniref:Acetyl/propionyl/methylcrotonyl-CoA carboxylase subunit alpha n=1 Tax=Jiella mangrovi TaxID=2821407 RepID=A0ABS4BGJ4_9HYPH|nr:acetyl/propionyl/methylcrotonyl-CoA carboxylase subunit alpha [Jiella mangrovi]MBP0615868.1 acetyl/propionyl/methylcrotonyl-CoA carboxylase subunit alpha [Jiella mangrovi]